MWVSERLSRRAPSGRTLRWVFMCTTVVTLTACRGVSWEDYMEVGYEAYQDGRYAEAEEMFLAAAGRVESFGRDDLRRATTFSNLADLYRAQARYGEAEGLYRQALEVLAEALGTEHPRVAMSLDNLAGFYLEQGWYTEAEPLYASAVAILETALGPEHPDVVASLAGLAAVYYHQDRYSEAEPLYQRVLGVYERVLDPEDIRMAETMEAYADLLRRTAREAQAVEMEARARAIRGDP